MSGHSSGPTNVTLVLSKRDAAIVAAALRQYEPYLFRGDLDSAEKLSELAQDIRDLLDRLKAIEPGSRANLPRTFSRTEPDLRLVDPHTSANQDDPT